MATLEELGLIKIGNYVRGYKQNITLNKEAVNKLNGWFPKIEPPPYFSVGDRVEIVGKLPVQEYADLRINVRPFTSEGQELQEPILVSLKDDWFERQDEAGKTQY